jgi:hypothetical protein
MFSSVSQAPAAPTKQRDVIAELKSEMQTLQVAAPEKKPYGGKRKISSFDLADLRRRRRRTRRRRIFCCNDSDMMLLKQMPMETFSFQ